MPTMGYKIEYIKSDVFDNDGDGIYIRINNFPEDKLDEFKKLLDKYMEEIYDRIK